jgi:hypothetical protein
MNITNFPVAPIINKDGDLHHTWKNWFNQLTNQVQTFLSDEHYVLPRQPVKVGTSVQDLNVRKSEGGILYDNDTKSGKINTEDGYSNDPPNKTYSFKTVVTYEEATSAKVAAIPSGQRNGRIIYQTDLHTTVIGINDAFVNL